jgi:hypothetical protein
MRFSRLILALACSGLLSGCATYHLTLRPLRGIPASEAAWLKQGQLAVGKDQLFDAVAATLEHEPYLHWDIELLDRVNGFIKASAGLFREVQLRVTAVEDGRSQLAVSIPRRELKTRAKIWVRQGDPGQCSAYPPAQGHSGDYGVVSADVELDDLYFSSFTWHVLHDRAEVPFDLVSYPSASDAADAAGAPGPSSRPSEAPVAVDQAPAPASPASTSFSAGSLGSPSAGAVTPAALSPTTPSPGP